MPEATEEKAKLSRNPKDWYGERRQALADLAALNDQGALDRLELVLRSQTEDGLVCAANVLKVLDDVSEPDRLRLWAYALAFHNVLLADQAGLTEPTVSGLVTADQAKHLHGIMEDLSKTYQQEKPTLLEFANHTWNIVEGETGDLRTCVVGTLLHSPFVPYVAPGGQEVSSERWDEVLKGSDGLLDEVACILASRNKWSTIAEKVLTLLGENVSVDDWPIVLGAALANFQRASQDSAPSQSRLVSALLLGHEGEVTPELEAKIRRLVFTGMRIFH